MVCFYFERFAVWLDGDFPVKQTNVIEIQICKHLFMFILRKAKADSDKVKLYSTSQQHFVFVCTVQTIYYKTLFLLYLFISFLRLLPDNVSE